MDDLDLLPMLTALSVLSPGDFIGNSLKVSGVFVTSRSDFWYWRLN